MSNTFKTRQFIELYNIFDDLLRDKYKEYSRSFSMVQRYINQLENSSSEDKHKKARMINMMRILRNDLVHEFDLNSTNIIEISDETIKFLQDEIDELKNPLTAYDVCTKTEQLFFATLTSKVKDVVSKMISKGFTQVPVLTQDKKIIGVFSPNCLFQYIANHSEEFNKNSGLTISAFQDYLPINRHISEAYVVVERDCPLDEVFELFDKSHRSAKKLAAILITEHGEVDQRLLGLIVPIDLLKNRDDQ